MVTGDVHHEQAYQDVVAVRNGSKPRADGRSVSLQILMKQAVFTDAEFAKLKQAEDLSNELAKIETVAMNMVKGQFDDGNGGFTTAGAPDLEQARRLMHDQNYEDAKGRIMQPINEFSVLLDQRAPASTGAALR